VKTLGYALLPLQTLVEKKFPIFLPNPIFKKHPLLGPPNRGVLIPGNLLIDHKIVNR